MRTTLVCLICGLLAISDIAPVVARGGGGGAVHVRGYIKKDGTYVAPHYRSAPDGDTGNNWSTKGNFNPYTGEEGTRLPQTPPYQGPNPPPGKERAGSPSAVYYDRTQETGHQTKEAQGNFNHCLSDSLLCNRSMLTPVQAQQVREAEVQRNFRSCLSDTDPSMCMRGMLTPVQVQQVREAEVQRNFNHCYSDSSPSKCNRSMLTPVQARQIREVEAQRNFKTCLSDTDPSMCMRGMLTPVQAQQVREAEAQRQAAKE